MWSFFDFQYGFRSSQSTKDLATAVFDRIDKSFNRSAATRTVAPDISKTLTRFDVLVLWNFRSSI